MIPGEVMCGDGCDECSYRATLSGCAGQPNATRCTRRVEYAIRPIGHRVPTYRCTQCYCQSVIDRNAAWGERYRMFRLLRELRVERAGGWRSYVMGGRAAHAWKRLAKKLKARLAEVTIPAKQYMAILDMIENPGEPTESLKALFRRDENSSNHKEPK